jgi:diguanylate cyclase (GGDEF)-like protein
MKTYPIARWRSAIRRNRPVVQGGSLLAAIIAFAAYVAYEYTIFSPLSTTLQHEKIIDLDEVLALTVLFCVGLLVLTWRLVLSERREVARRVSAEHRSHHDFLTGLANRRQFDQELEASIAAPPRIGGAHAVFMLDLNDFKRINDVYGHATGDEVLIHVAMRLQRAVREGDLVARFGGDEFVILARQLAGAEEASRIALRVIKELDQPITIASIQHQIGIAVGIALFPQDGQNDVEIMRKADTALYRAKVKSGSASRFFEAAIDTRVRECDAVEGELPAAISAGTIQPPTTNH